ncbi:MAG: MATE family efflux transporter [Clostridia bacterium]|nr:MATE family efflux transporter [Clostridia bacterium]
MEQTQTQGDFYLAKAPIKKLLLKFSIPCILSMLVSALYNIVDQIFIGMRLQEAGIYATTVVYPFTVIALAIALLIGDGCAALFSISLGEKDTKSGNKSVGNAILVSIISSLVLALLGLVLREQILQICGATADSLALARSYYNIILIGLPFYIITSTLSSIIRADGSPRYAMMATLIGAIINLILDPIFILVFNWGIEGAAIATIVGQIASAVVSLIYLKKTKLIKLDKDSFKLSGKTIGKFCKLGLSSFITQFSIALITVVANVVVRAINDPVLGDTGPGGVLGVVFKIFGIIIAFSVGVAVGGQPIIGYNYGAKNYKRVFETYKYILIVNIIVGLIATILFMACPIIFAKLFSISEIYLDFACKCFRIYLGGILLCCIQKASCIFLQSINKPYKSMILSLMRDVIFLIPGVCLFGLLGGLEMMLWAGLITDGLSFIFTIIFVVIEYKKLNGKTQASHSTTTLSPASGYVITIGREFGSGGKYVAEKLAQRLGIKCYDKEILSALSKETSIDIETLEKLDEKEKSSFWYGCAINTVFANSTTASADDQIFLSQAKIIEELANEGSCVIVGRCSDAILSNRANTVNAFIYSSSQDFKIQRKMDLEGLSRDEAIKKIEQVDKQRANYYNRYSGKVWGNRENYDISIDTSKVGIDGAVEILENYIKQKTWN